MNEQFERRAAEMKARLMGERIEQIKESPLMAYNKARHAHLGSLSDNLLADGHGGIAYDPAHYLPELAIIGDPGVARRWALIREFGRTGVIGRGARRTRAAVA